MTRLGRGSKQPSSKKTMERVAQHAPAARVSDNPWDLLLRNSLALDSEDKTLDRSYKLRLAGFQYLIYRYMIQIRYGCINEHCTMPTCFSCVSRIADKPLRRPTHITTRTLAYHLASQDDPTAGLCGNVPAAWPELKSAAELLTHPSFRPPDIDPRSLSQNLFNSHVARTLNQGEEPEVHSSEWYEERNAEYKAFHIRAGICPCGCRQPLKDALTEGASQKDELGGLPATNGSIKLSYETSKASRNGHISVDGAYEEGSSGTTDLSEDDLNALNHQEHKKQVSGSSRAEKPVHGNGSVRYPNGSLKGPYKQLLVTSSSKHSVESSPGQHNTLHSKSNNIPPSTVATSLPKDTHVEKRVVTISHLSCEIMERLKRLGSANADVRAAKGAVTEPSQYLDDYRSEPFSSQYVDQSLSYGLSNPAVLIKSFREKPAKSIRGSPLPHLDPSKLEHAFRTWQGINGPLIFDSLWFCLEALFVPPPELKIRKNGKGKHSKLHALDPNLPGRRNPNKESEAQYISDGDAAHIIMICIHALTSLVTKGRPQSWKEVRNLRGQGIVLPNTSSHKRPNDSYSMPWLDTIDQLEYEPAIRLADRLARAIAARRCFTEIVVRTATKQGSEPHYGSPIHIVLAHLIHVEKQRRKNISAEGDDMKWKRETWGSWSITGVFIEWLRTLILKRWKGQNALKRWDTVGAAAEILADMYDIRSELGLHKCFFHVHYLKEKLDTVELTTSYLEYKEDPNTLHLLHLPFFFPDYVLVNFFRTLNYSSMLKWHTMSGNNFSLQDRFGRHFLSTAWRMYLNEHYSIASSRYLKLDLRRSNVLEDTLDQLWGLEKRQLLLPLKVRMGVDEGERGVDQGGVAQEFFRVALGEAFNPDNGMFTVDPQTRMTWFQPFSLEPLSRFELIGLLFSIAIYNGITLPVTFPKVFYRRLLGKSATSTYQIRDGWPDLAKSFDFLLSCEDEVGDLLSRGYEFSFEARGLIININMAALDAETPSPYTILDYTDTDDPFHPVVNWPPEPAEAPLVTNANRHQYVQDYITWLTDKSIKPQFDAFLRGFRTCLPAPHLALLRPSLLRRTVEGSTHIDTHALERVTRYDGNFSADQPFIRDFWAIVHAWDQERKRKLLEFVTASDRVPVAGIESVVFWVQRNGPDTESLPTSSTCFGRLLLPEYCSREKTERKLGVAIENAKGFGAA